MRVSALARSSRLSITVPHRQRKQFVRQRSDGMQAGAGRSSREHSLQPATRLRYAVTGGTIGCSGIAAPSVLGSLAPKFTPLLVSRMTASPLPMTAEKAPKGPIT
jgi:hypothetical protein